MHSRTMDDIFTFSSRLRGGRGSLGHVTPGNGHTVYRKEGPTEIPHRVVLEPSPSVLPHGLQRGRQLASRDNTNQRLQSV